MYNKDAKPPKNNQANSIPYPYINNKNEKKQPKKNHDKKSLDTERHPEEETIKNKEFIQKEHED
ncbi:MAG: hypothetical protein SGJ18_02560 [Pseudomonadota bacterium]|nr:hypothetical protein [Pseudomonadota bacterium]